MWRYCCCGFKTDFCSWVKVVILLQGSDQLFVIPPPLCKANLFDFCYIPIDDHYIAIIIDCFLAQPSGEHIYSTRIFHNNNKSAYFGYSGFPWCLCKSHRLDYFYQHRETVIVVTQQGQDLTRNVAALIPVPSVLFLMRLLLFMWRLRHWPLSGPTCSMVHICRSKCFSGIYSRVIVIGLTLEQR